jgi:hypothetical protein
MRHSLQLSRLSVKKRLISWIVIPVVVIGAVIAGGALSIEYFMRGFGACKTMIHSSIPSPDGSKSIVIFEKGCGATVGFNTQVSIAPSQSAFSAERYPPFYVVSGQQEVQAKWRGNETVEVNIPGADQTFKREERVGSITIVYL